MSIRVEAKCPCCNKRMYIHVSVCDAETEDTYDRIRAKEEAERQARRDSMTPEQQAECQRLLDGTMKDLKEEK